MNVCLVLCPGWYPQAPALGPALLKAYLRARGHEVRTIDFGGVTGAPPGDPVSEILKDRPDVVGFTVYQTTWSGSVALAERIKAREPRVSIVFGGPEGVRFLSEPARFGQRMHELGAVDALVPGEGELALVELLKRRSEDGGFGRSPGAFVKEEGSFVWSEGLEPVADLDSLPFPDFADYRPDRYGNSLQLVTYFSRGCPKKCVFCDVETYWKSWRNRSGRRVIEEVEHLARKHSEAREFIFCDSILNAHIGQLREFCGYAVHSMATGRLPPISWWGYAVARREMTYEIFRAMRSAGCRQLLFGIESGSQKVLNAMRKGCLVETAESVLRDCRRAGIDTIALMMVGFPTETEADFEQTVSFVERNAASIGLLSPSEAFTYIDSGAPLWDSAYDRYGVARATFHSSFWESQDGRNNYPERLRRFERLCLRARAAGVAVGPTWQTVSREKDGKLAEYEAFRSRLAPAT